MKRRDVLSTFAASVATLLTPFKLFANKKPEITIMLAYSERNSQITNHIWPVQIQFLSINSVRITSDDHFNSSKCVCNLGSLSCNVLVNGTIVESWCFTDPVLIENTTKFGNRYIKLPNLSSDMLVQFRLPETIQSKYIKNPFLT